MSPEEIESLLRAIHGLDRDAVGVDAYIKERMAIRAQPLAKAADRIGHAAQATV